MDINDEEVSDAFSMPRSTRVTREISINTNRNQPIPNLNLDAEWEQEFMLSEPLIFVGNEEVTYNCSRTKVLIFNNFQYVKSLKLTDRTGSLADRDDLEHLFTTLNHDVQTHKEESEGFLTKEKLFDTIKEVIIGHEEFDALVLIVMTHGNLTELAAYDQKYEIKELLDLFKDKMNGKPKLIVLNSCRQDQSQQILNNKTGEFFSELSVDNCMVVYTAYPGFLGYRSKDKGSRLIRSLRKALRMLVDLKEERLLLDLFTDIKRHVCTKPNPCNPQMPIVQHNLEKRFFFGYKENVQITSM